VIRSPEVHKKVLFDILAFAQNEGFGIRGLIKSPLLGPKGNTEFLVWLTNNRKEINIPEIIDSLFKE
jgi:23S rRNA (cytidine1920-2'-O)/16S rRNA (cytidine1409-2'-O)-methyltransferase